MMTIKNLFILNFVFHPVGIRVRIVLSIPCLLHLAIKWVIPLDMTLKSDEPLHSRCGAVMIFKAQKPGPKHRPTFCSLLMSVLVKTLAGHKVTQKQSKRVFQHFMKMK